MQKGVCNPFAEDREMNLLGMCEGVANTLLHICAVGPKPKRVTSDVFDKTSPIGNHFPMRFNSATPMASSPFPE